MKILALYLLLLLGFLILAYYVYLIFIGKSLARLIDSKDRFIWNGLKDITDRASSGRVILFLDDKNLTLSRLSLPSTYRQVKKDQLDNALQIDFKDIVEFDYVKGGLPLLSPIINKIFKINSFKLKLAYYDESRQLVKRLYKAPSMDPLDFEVSFADFNSKIYGQGGLRMSSEPRESLNPITPSPSLTSQNQQLNLTDQTSRPVQEEKTTLHRAADLEEALEKVSEEKTEVMKAEDLEKLLPKEKPVVEADRTSEKTELMGVEEFKASLEKVQEAQEAPGDKTEIIKADDLKAVLEDSKTDKKDESKDQDKTSRFGFLSRKQNGKEKIVEKKTTSPVFSQETGTVTRRSFLDKGPKKEEAKAAPKTKLPDELKRVDTEGLSPDEVEKLELERIEKLKEFFTEQKKD